VQSELSEGVADHVQVVGGRSRVPGAEDEVVDPAQVGDVLGPESPVHVREDGVREHGRRVRSDR
jgi:hypothetical protein